ncbi:MAG TPA: RES family NAD+ phosphorylase [Blastocatellia bacterium]
MNLGVCGSLLLSGENRTWYRAVRPQFFAFALRSSHTRSTPSRFNAGKLSNPQFDVLYLAENHQVALFEVQALLGSPPGPIVPNPHQGPWTIISVSVRLSGVADLTSRASQVLLDTNAQELTGDWMGYASRAVPMSSISYPVGVAPTQELGTALYSTPHIEAFITISARIPDKMALVVFPQKLQPGNYMRFLDPGTGQVVSIP